MADDVPIPPEEVAALLAVPQDAFVAARTARVKELRAEGRRDVAAALAKVRKPLRLVWLVGELARRHPDDAADAAAVAEELEDAQAAGTGVRPLLARFRTAVAEVAERADELDGTVDRLEVGLALREVLADPEARAAWLGGHLLALPGDDEEGPAVAPAPTRARRPSKAAGRRSSPSAEPAAPEEDDSAEDEAARREWVAQVEAADAEVATAEQDLAAAEEALAEEAAAAEALAEELARVEERLAAARERQEAAAATVAEGEEAVAAARAARTALDASPTPRRPGW